MPTARAFCAMRTIGVDATTGSISRPILQDMAVADFVTAEAGASAVVEPVLLEVAAIAEAEAMGHEVEYEVRKSA